MALCWWLVILEYKRIILLIRFDFEESRKNNGGYYSKEG